MVAQTSFVIPNKETAIEEIMNRFMSDVESHRYDSATSFALILGMAESLNNAYRHGNRQDPARFIAVRYRLRARSAEIHVIDDGEGFDPGAVVDPRANENLKRPGGRGILLMRALFDTVKFEHGGRQVRLMRKTTVA